MNFNSDTIEPYLNKVITLKYKPEKFGETNTVIDHNPTGRITQLRKKDFKFQMFGRKNKITIKYKDLISIDKPEKS